MERIAGTFVGGKVIIKEDLERAQEYLERGFGELVGVKEKWIELAPVEAGYLIERGKLDVYYKGKKLTFEQFATRASKYDKRFWTRYLVYREIRSRGYIVKTALKFGADFRVYPRGKKPGQAHAKWVLFATQESENYKWREFAAMNRVAHSTRKKLLIGIVDDEGDVTYYEVRWVKP